MLTGPLPLLPRAIALDGVDGTMAERLGLEHRRDEDSPRWDLCGNHP